MRKLLFILSALVIFYLSACSTSKETTSHESPTQLKGELASIQVSQYVTGTTRTQPELTVLYDKQEDLMLLQQKFEGAEVPQSFPEDKSISKIQVVVFFYEENGQTVRSDGYMFVTFQDGIRYSKLIQSPNHIQDVYPYNESDNELVIRRAGTDGWRQTGDTNNLL
ncbi:hypothetical protein [Cohnella terricola]|uniref:Lipoprotein n=1 Tax=Cohnella terricola TaxID=1289167 RepID=A0A559JWT4_9BACL|nr:hypothetical protein [Cohnella terricola]TVY04351.1 hypothetical protein FPZ45_01820 [Cohnella terricola]